MFFAWTASQRPRSCPARTSTYPPSTRVDSDMILLRIERGGGEHDSALDEHTVFGLTLGDERSLRLSLSACHSSAWSPRAGRLVTPSRRPFLPHTPVGLSVATRFHRVRRPSVFPQAGGRDGVHARTPARVSNAGACPTLATPHRSAVGVEDMKQGCPRSRTPDVAAARRRAFRKTHRGP